MHHDHAGAEQGFQREIPVGHGIHAVVEYAVHAQFRRHRGGIERVCRAGQGRRAQRGNAGTPLAILQAVHIAFEHPGVGQQMLRQAYGLRGLEVGAAGEDDFTVFLGLVHKDGRRPDRKISPCGRAVGHEQSKIQGHLIVAAAPGVEFFAHIAHKFRQAAFDVHVHVFQFAFPLEDAGLDFRPYGVKSGRQLIRLGGREHALSRQHTGVGLRPGDILPVEGAVVGNGFGIRLDGGGRSLVEAAAPKLFLCHVDPA